MIGLRVKISPFTTSRPTTPPTLEGLDFFSAQRSPPFYVASIRSCREQNFTVSLHLHASEQIAEWALVAGRRRIRCSTLLRFESDVSRFV